MSEPESPPTPERAVFDANLFVQTVIGGRGPSFACIELVRSGGVELVVTEAILGEVEAVLLRLSRKAKYQATVTSERVAEFMADLRRIATIAPEPPHVFDLERDPDDEVYIDLAVAVGAVYLTSRDNDLLDLMDPGTKAGAEFRERFPGLAILDPVAFLRRMREGAPP